MTELTTIQGKLLTETTAELESIRSMKGELKSTENVLEHLFQFILSLVLLMGSASGFTFDFINFSLSEIKFAIFSSVVSTFSMVRGQVALISTQKNGQLGILAKCVLFPYMVIAILIRVGIIILCIIGSSDILQTFGESHVQSNELFIIVLVAVLILHVLSSFLIQKRYLNGTKRNMKQALWSFLSPPLFLDWDFLHNQETYKMPIPECWRRTRNSFFLHNFLTLVGNLALGIPFFIYRTQPLLNRFSSSWCYSWCGWYLDWFLITFLAIVHLSQLILVGLGFLYWRRLHPWARILNEEIARENNASQCIPHFFHAKWYRRVDILGVRTS